ncbi:hypothetical protein HYC85_002046 [Camellia sinensis]|uniref:Auxin efflux carrier family protein n=1 Tax=Camellia sinensis TaxID=4442 RepID=A0A7J7I8J0_CAMSI|nr:hypothetical protein HYC85_002046 [Camellia sinensis]
MGFLDLFIVALMPVLKTLIITAIGLFLAIDPVNLLGPVARHHLNQLVFYVFTPALVASNLADTITSSNIVSLWFMPVNILLTFILGSGAWMGNLGNLLLIIIPAVCDESNSPFGDSSTCSTNGEAYASLSMAIGAVYIWTYIYNIIRMSGSKSNEEVNANGSRTSGKSPGETSENAQPLLSTDYTSSEDYESHVEIAPIGSEEKLTVFEKIKKNVNTFAEKVNLKMVLAPSTIATGGGNPIHDADRGMPTFSRVIFYMKFRFRLKKSGVGIWVIIGVNVVRYIALPLLGILVIKGARYLGFVGSNSLYEFVLLIQYALPSAMTIGTITQLFEVGESECSVIMLWNYAVAAIALTLWATYYMWLVS